MQAHKYKNKSFYQAFFCNNLLSTLFSGLHKRYPIHVARLKLYGSIPGGFFLKSILGKGAGNRAASLLGCFCPVQLVDLAIAFFVGLKLRQSRTVR